MGARVLIIGYGNTLRGDDGVGPRVAAAAGWRGDFDVRAVHQLTPDLAPALAEADVAIFVDARPSDPDGEVEISPLDAGGDAPPLTHGSDPRGLLALAESLYGRRPRAWWVTVPAVEFGVGERLSPTTQRAMGGAVSAIERLVAGGGRRA